MIKPFCIISDTPSTKTDPIVMKKLHDWLSDLKVHKSHYSRGHSPMRQYTDSWLNVSKLWRDYISAGMRQKFEYVTQNVFRDVFTKVYNIGTRYVF